MPLAGLHYDCRPYPHFEAIHDFCTIHTFYSLSVFSMCIIFKDLSAFPMRILFIRSSSKSLSCSYVFSLKSRSSLYDPLQRVYLVHTHSRQRFNLVQRIFFKESVLSKVSIMFIRILFKESIESIQETKSIEIILETR